MLEDNSPLFKPGNYNVLKQKTVVGSARSLMEADLLFHFPQFKFLMRLSNNNHGHRVLRGRGGGGGILIHI